LSAAHNARIIRLRSSAEAVDPGRCSVEHTPGIAGRLDALEAELEKLWGVK